MRICASLFKKVYDYLHIYNFLPRRAIPNVDEFSRIFIDLSSPSNHLGDLFFFGPLILRLHQDNRLAGVDDYFGFYKNILKIDTAIPSDFTIYRSDNWPNCCSDTLPSYCVNFYNSSPVPISKYIYNLIFVDRYSDFTRNFAHVISQGACTDFTDTCSRFGQYILFSPFINSRKFGFFPNSKIVLAKMLERVKCYKSSGINIVLVGSVGSCGNHLPDNFLDYVDIDLRGKTNLNQLISLVKSKNCCSVVTYDTFTYHLSFLLGAPIDLYTKSWLTPHELKWISKRYYPAFNL